MRTAREEEQQQKPYESGGLGAGGKFRKKPFRKTTHTTPYDRPPTAFRNPNGGWLSKLVDPAHRLITSSARRLFTVFRKRLPPPQPPSPEANWEAWNKQQEAIATDSLGAQKGAIDQSDGPINSASGGELTELEQILQQKTFTRSEIDRLTALLHSRTVDLPIEDQEKISEVVPLKPVTSTDGQEGFLKTPAAENRVERERFSKTPALQSRTENELVSTPVVSSTVLEEDVASPTDLVELAKSYMHKRPISPSMLGFRSQAIKENSTAIYTRNLTPPMKLSITPVLPRTSGHAEARENGFITPRSRGRSAIYSMARTPYSRVRPTTFKGVENAVEVYAGPSSSSQYSQDQSLLSRSKGDLKRRSSVLDNDIGSFGAVRRIRHKPSLLSSRGLSLPVSGSPHVSSGSGLGSEVPSSSVLNPPSFGEPKRNFIKPSTENADNIGRNTTVPFKSSEMASKILQQLDKLVSPKEKSSEPKGALMGKSPSKLSPSMLRGQALKSLEDVDSSKFLGDVQNSKMLDGSLNKIILPDAQEFTSQRQEKVNENGPLQLDSAYGKPSTKVNGPKVNGAMVSRMDAVPSIATSVPAAFNSVARPPHKKRGFQMSAHEDYVDLDDDSHSNGTASDLLVEGTENVNSSLAERKSSAAEDVKLYKAPALTEIKPLVLEMNQKTDMGTLTGSMTAEESANLMFQSTSTPSMTVPPTFLNTESSLASDRATPLKESNVSPPFSGKIASTTDTNAASTIFNFGLKRADKAPDSQLTFSSPSVSEYGSVKFDASDSKPETSSNLSTVAAGAKNSVLNLPEPDKADNKNHLNAGVSFRTPETSTSTTGIFSFGATPSNVSSLNTTTSSSPVFSNLPSQNSLNSSIFTNSGSNVSSVSTTTATTFTFASSTISLSTSTPAPSVPAALVFNFGSSTASDAAPVSITRSEPASSVFEFGSSMPLKAGAAVSETSSVPAASVSKFGSFTPSTSETSTVPAASVFKFGSSTPSTAVAPVSESSSVPAASVSKFGSFTPSTSETSTVPAASVFKFGSSTPSTAVAPVSESSTVPSASVLKFGPSPTSTAVAPVPETSEAIKTKQDMSAVTLSGTPFGNTSAAIASTGSTLFGFTAGATSTSVNQSQASTSLGDGSASVPSAQASTAGTGVAPFSQSLTPQFGLSASSPSFGLTGSTTFASSSSPFGSTLAAKPFSSGTTGLGSSSLSETNLVSSSSSSTPSLFGSNWQPPKSLVFGFNSSPSTGFSFGAPSAAGATTNSSPALFGASAASAVTNGAPMAFASSNGAASSSLFSFNSSSATASTQPVFGNPSPFTFVASTGNNDQMNMEDSMAEDTIQASAPTVPVFGQQTISPSPSTSGFVFDSAPPTSVGNLFQFGSQPNLANPQNPSLFQASGSLGLIGEGGNNFSLGSGGSVVDKSNRKFVKVKHKQRKK